MPAPVSPSSAVSSPSSPTGSTLTLSAVSGTVVSAVSEERGAFGPRTVNDPERYVRCDQHDLPRLPRLTDPNAAIVNQIQAPHDAEELLKLGFRYVFDEFSGHGK